MLSGFVIGYAYDDRWNRMSLKDFFKRRLIRLHPMVVMGSVIGALFFYFQAAAFPMIADVAWWKSAADLSAHLHDSPQPPAWTSAGGAKPVR